MSSLQELKLVAVAVVAQAVWSMGQRLCPDRQRAAIALLAAVLLLAIGGVTMQVVMLVLGAPLARFSVGASP